MAHGCVQESVEKNTAWCWTCTAFLTSPAISLCTLNILWYFRGLCLAFNGLVSRAWTKALPESVRDFVLQWTRVVATVCPRRQRIFGVVIVVVIDLTIYLSKLFPVERSGFPGRTELIKACPSRVDVVFSTSIASLSLRRSVCLDLCGFFHEPLN
jgi:hypothetical protein